MAIGEDETILTKLKDDLDKDPLPSGVRFDLVARLKVLGRDPKQSPALYKADGIQTVARQGLYRTKQPDEASREALRCLANALLLQASTRQALVDLQFTSDVVTRLEGCEHIDEFLYSRILLFLTYGTNLDFSELVKKHGLATAIVHQLCSHRDFIARTDKERTALPQPQEMALSETLKLYFNVNSRHPELSPEFLGALEPILTILMFVKPEKAPLDPPVTNLVNALLNTQLEGKDAEILPTGDDSLVHVKRLIDLLRDSCSAYSDSDLESKLAPLLTLIRQIYHLYPTGTGEYLRNELLPTEEERTKPLGKSDSLSSRLLQLSTSPRVIMLRDLIQGMLFELSDKDPKKFIENVGYGNAAGFLMNNKIPVPNEMVEDNMTGPSGGIGQPNGQARSDVNFVTGQYLADEPKEDGPPMTEEEKLREAERLFVLFERLKQTGVVDVKNPVEEAVDSGRFQELGDDE